MRKRGQIIDLTLSQSSSFEQLPPLPSIDPTIGSGLWRENNQAKKQNTFPIIPLPFPFQNQERPQTNLHPSAQQGLQTSGASSFGENQGYYFNKNVNGDIRFMDQKYARGESRNEFRFSGQHSFTEIESNKQYQIHELNWKEFYNDPEEILYQNPLSNNFMLQPNYETSVFKRKSSEQSNNLFQRELERKNQTCEICYEKLDDSFLYSLINCCHSYHIHCLKSIIIFNIEIKKLPCLCPNDLCLRQFSEEDIKFILSVNEFEKYKKVQEKVEVQRNSHLYFWCRTPDCDFYVLKSSLVSSEFSCKKCDGHYCANCEKNWHYGPCQFDVEDDEFLRFAKKKLFKTCPKCRKLVEKISGCHHITCICRFEFCYICEKDYRNQCQCKNLSFGEHRIMMANQRKQQQQLAKMETKMKRQEKKAQKKMLMEIEKEEKRKKREQMKEEKRKVKEEKRLKMMALRQAREEFKMQRKPRKIVKKDINYGEE